MARNEERKMANHHFYVSRVCLRRVSEISEIHTGVDLSVVDIPYFLIPKPLII